ncbi:spore germination protein KA [Bacillus mesophilus]|uniref:Spore germination protein n=1 Tax=Bacillus mesophilus TaxID=1808955 RepID=A0A6M0Q311_9BACI|nr:spore germination protein [Bacillus mesophilus]MBM7659868.1 spore germination protein KA [Bacillus mesophilus]NEY70727.1 spore germination protein [Bacillus mesophilus]
MKKLTDWVRESQKQQNKPEVQPDKKTPLQRDLAFSIQKIKKDIGQSPDVIIREMVIGKETKTKIAVIYIDGLVDKQFVHEFILTPLLYSIRESCLGDVSLTGESFYEILKDYSLTIGELTTLESYEDVLNRVLSGDTVLFLDGEASSFSLGTRGWEGRGVEEPSTEQVIRGPKEGFTETIRTNTGLIRRRIRDKNLMFEYVQIGRRSKTDVSIAYMKDLADEKIIQEVRDRLSLIDIDTILEGGYIEELIQDETMTPFPTVYNTERPDVVVGGLMEGRVAIIVDGTPFVLLVPALFIHFMQSSEDYYQRADISTLIRLLRFTAFLMSLLVPSAYIAVTTYHQEMLPTALLVSLSAQREGVPFPAVVEALIMELTFEILREAGLRMPRAIGSAISIVGALVIGQAAVEAGLISATMVIVVSLTAISSFVIPKFNMSISTRILRFGFMILAATFGLFGIILGLLGLVFHLTSLRSFGIPYMAPFAPIITSDLKDTLVRTPLWKMNTRPRLINQKDIIKNKTPEPDTKTSTSHLNQGDKN